MSTLDPRKIQACANQECGLRVCSDRSLGGFCCRGCHASLASGVAPQHDAACEQVPAAPFLPRAPCTPPVQGPGPWMRPLRPLRPALGPPSNGRQIPAAIPALRGCGGTRVIRAPGPPRNGIHCIIPAAATKRPLAPQHPPPKKARIAAAWSVLPPESCDHFSEEEEEDEDASPVPQLPAIPKAAKAAQIYKKNGYAELTGPAIKPAIGPAIKPAIGPAVRIPKAVRASPATYEDGGANQPAPGFRGIPKVPKAAPRHVEDGGDGGGDAGGDGGGDAVLSGLFRGVPKAIPGTYEEDDDDGDSLEEQLLSQISPCTSPPVKLATSTASERSEEEVVTSTVDFEALERKAENRAEERFAMGEATLADLKLLGRRKGNQSLGFTFAEGIAEDFMVCHTCLQVHGSINDPEILECAACPAYPVSPELEPIIRSFSEG